MKLKWIIIFLAIFMLIGVLLFKVYSDLSQTENIKSSQQNKENEKKPDSLTKEERIVLKDESVRKLLVMLSNGDYKIPSLFDKAVFGKEYKDMDGQEKLVYTESIFKYFLEGNRFYNANILSAKRGDKGENDMYRIFIEYQVTNYTERKEMDIEVNSKGKIVTPIPVLELETEEHHEE